MLVEGVRPAPAVAHTVPQHDLNRRLIAQVAPPGLCSLLPTSTQTTSPSFTYWTGSV
jgi:hypothetical protein